MQQRHEVGGPDVESEPEIYWIRIVPRKHTGETISLLIALLVLFALLVLLVGHPGPPARSRFVVPAHSFEKR
jgi:hypothetical protein